MNLTRFAIQNIILSTQNFQIACQINRIIWFENPLNFRNQAYY